MTISDGVRSGFGGLGRCPKPFRRGAGLKHVSRWLPDAWRAEGEMTIAMTRELTPEIPAGV